MNYPFSKLRQSKSFIPLVLLAFLVAFFWPVFFKGYVLSPSRLLLQIFPWKPPGYQLLASGNSLPVNGIFWDQVTEMYPWQKFLVDTVRQFHLPLWNPYNGMGYPLFANSQSAFFFPLSWIAFFMPIGMAITVGDIIKLLVSGWGTYLFLREIGLGKRASLFGGMTFMLCGWNIVWLNVPLTNPSSLLPWAFFLIERYLQKSEVRSLAGLSVVVALQILGGHMETAAHCGLAAGLYALSRLIQAAWEARQWRRETFRAAALMGSYVFGVVLASAEFLPFLGSLYQSHAYQARSQPTLTPSTFYYLSPVTAFTLLVPDFLGHPAFSGSSYDYLVPTFGNYNERMQYIGILPLIMALFAVLYSLRERRSWSFVGILLLCWLCIALSQFTAGLQ